MILNGIRGKVTRGSVLESVLEFDSYPLLWRVINLLWALYLYRVSTYIVQESYLWTSRVNGNLVFFVSLMGKKEGLKFLCQICQNGDSPRYRLVTNLHESQPETLNSSSISCKRYFRNELHLLFRNHLRVIGTLSTTFEKII